MVLSLVITPSTLVEESTTKDKLEVKCYSTNHHRKIRQRTNMEQITIYHNARCSKSRQALEILHSKGIAPTVVEYLKTPLNMEQLQQLRAHFALQDFVRSSEPIFKELGLSLDNEEQLLQAMVKEPILMQRPIVTGNNKAVIGRPPENVLTVLA